MKRILIAATAAALLLAAGCRIVVEPMPYVWEWFK